MKNRDDILMEVENATQSLRASIDNMVCCESVAPHTKTTRQNPTPQDYRIEARKDCFDRITQHLWRLEDFKVIQETNGIFYYTLDPDKLALVLGLGMARK